MKSIVVLYHKDCPDGFSAAWAARKKFGDRADYIGVEPRQLPPKLPKNSEVFVIDNSYSPKNLKKFIERGNKVTVIDHHPSSENDVGSAPSFVFDLNHSGSMLAWKFFHPEKPMPRLLKHIEDLDLWKFKMPKTKEIAAYIELLEFNFKIWDKIASDLENPSRRESIINQGAVILRYKTKIISNIAKRTQIVIFEGIKTMASNSVVLRSEVGNYLVKKIMPPIGIVWSVKKDGNIWIGLYSDGSLDVSKIAKKYGGGGHKAAAGFIFPKNKKLPWKVLKN